MSVVASGSLAHEGAKAPPRANPLQPCKRDASLGVGGGVGVAGAERRQGSPSCRPPPPEIRDLAPPTLSLRSRSRWRRRSLTDTGSSLADRSEATWQSRLSQWGSWREAPEGVINPQSQRCCKIANLYPARGASERVFAVPIAACGGRGAGSAPFRPTPRAVLSAGQTCPRATDKKEPPPVVGSRGVADDNKCCTLAPLRRFMRTPPLRRRRARRLSSADPASSPPAPAVRDGSAAVAPSVSCLSLAGLAVRPPRPRGVEPRWSRRGANAPSFLVVPLCPRPFAASPLRCGGGALARVPPFSASADAPAEIARGLRLRGIAPSGCSVGRGGERRHSRRSTYSPPRWGCNFPLPSSALAAARVGSLPPIPLPPPCPPQGGLGEARNLRLSTAVGTGAVPTGCLAPISARSSSNCTKKQRCSPTYSA